jgi:hypothetical protein
MPEVALSIITTVNSISQTIWNWLPESVHQFLATYFGVTSFQINPGSAQTWLVILILALAISILLSRLLLPNRIRDKSSYVVYPVTAIGKFLGGLLGGLNGFLIINLVREYIDGRNLPSGTDVATANAAIAGQAASVASSGVDFGFTELPNYSQFNSTWAWVVMGLGFLLSLVVLRQRLSRTRTPSGHKRYKISPAKDKEGETTGGEWKLEGLSEWTWYKLYLGERKQ